MIVRYVTAEEFVNDFILTPWLRGPANGLLWPIHKKYRDVDVLLLDNIQFFAGRDHGTVLPHFQLSWSAQAKQIVIASMWL